jgi:hypothetical protein
MPLFQKLRSSVTNMLGPAQHGHAPITERPSKTSAQFGLERTTKHNAGPFSHTNDGAATFVDESGVLRRTLKKPGETDEQLRERLGSGAKMLTPSAALRDSEAEARALESEIDRIEAENAAIATAAADRAKERYRKLLAEQTALKGKLKATEEATTRLELLGGAGAKAALNRLPSPSALRAAWDRAAAGVPGGLMGRGGRYGGGAPHAQQALATAAGQHRVLASWVQRRRQQARAGRGVVNARKRASVALKSNSDAYEMCTVIDADGVPRQRLRRVGAMPDPHAELEAVRELEEGASHTGAPQLVGPCFAVSTAWMKVWLAYCIEGGAEPGPISNGELFERWGALRTDLKPRRDVRLVSRAVWELLLQRHGGGPEIGLTVPVGVGRDLRTWLRGINLAVELHASAVQKLWFDGRWKHTGVLLKRGRWLRKLGTRPYLFALGNRELQWFSLSGDGTRDALGTFLLSGHCELRLDEARCELDLVRVATSEDTEEDGEDSDESELENGGSDDEADDAALVQVKRVDAKRSKENRAARRRPARLTLVAADTEHLHAWYDLIRPLTEAGSMDTNAAGSYAAGLLAGSVGRDKMKAAMAMDADINAAAAEAIGNSMARDMAKAKMAKAIAMDGEINAAAADAIGASLAGDMAKKQMAAAMKMEEEVKAEQAAALAASLGGDLAKKQMAAAMKMEEESKAEQAVALARSMAGDMAKQKMAATRKMEMESRAAAAAAVARSVGGSMARKQLAAAVAAGDAAAAVEAAARMLQTAWRTLQSRREAARIRRAKDEAQLDAAARMLQNAWQGLQGRRRAAALRAAKEAKASEASARMMQAAWRSLQCRRRAAALREAKEAKMMEASARMFQCSWRKLKSRRQVAALKAEKARLMEEACASILQATWRSKQARRKVAALKAEKQRLLEEASALMLQAAWRVRKARGLMVAKRGERDDLKKSRGVLRCQAQWRAKQQRAHFLTHRRAAHMLQMIVRRRQANATVEQMGRAIERPFFVIVQNANGLRAGDANGSSDPFCFAATLHGSDDTNQVRIQPPPLPLCRLACRCSLFWPSLCYSYSCPNQRW